jgi:hypothetical protein
MTVTGSILRRGALVVHRARALVVSGSVLVMVIAWLLQMLWRP